MIIRDKKSYWVWLSLIFGPASRSAVKMLRYFGSAKKIFDASAADLIKSGTVKEKDRVYAAILRHDLGDADDIIRWCDKSGISILTPESREYPQNLLSLRDAPLVLYVAGDFPMLEKECAVAVVGTRKMTAYGKRCACSVGQGLALGGAVVVSGLALGVDGAAMAAALDANGKCIGVLGCGIDIVYPKEHKTLFKKVMNNGAVVTEYPPGTSPSRSSFPQRNRIISALAVGTVVVEADAFSGALITARHAVYQGKDLFAFPGSVDAFGAEGTNQLIKEGAFAVTEAFDILERYAYIYPHKLDLSASSKGKNVDFDGVIAKYGVKTEFDRHNIYSRPKNDAIHSSGAPKNSPSKDLKIKEPAKPSALEKISDEKADKDELSRSAKASPVEKKKSRVASKNKFENTPSEPLRIDFEILGEKEKSVYRAMQPDTPMLPEEIDIPGFKIQDIMASLTFLEISGAVEAGAGGYFMRSSAEDIFFFESGAETTD